jgi:two-component system LytT family response regulator
MKYKALIIDDEPNNREYLAGLLAWYCPSVEVVKMASSVEQALHVMQEYEPHVVFLDIEMPHGNGFEFLEKCESVDFKIIFVTAYDAYALRAIKYSALDYLLKPVVPEELIQAVDKLDLSLQDLKLKTLQHNLTNQQDRRISLTTQDEILFVKISEIIRLEAKSNYTQVFVEGEKPLLLSGNLGTFEKLLDDPLFYRTHQSHLINTRQVRKFVKTEGGHFLMSDKSQVPVARIKREEVKRLFF